MLPEPPPPELAPSCAEAGVLGVLPGIRRLDTGPRGHQAHLGHGDTLAGRLLAFDAAAMEFSEFRLNPDPKNQITYANRGRIEIAELTGLCAGVLHG